MKTKLLLIKFCLLLSLASANDGWVQKASMFDTRRKAVGFSINEKGYIAGGQRSVNGTSVYLKDLWEYYPGCDSWTQKADYPLTALFEGVGFSVGLFGYAGVAHDNKFYQYDPSTNTWTPKSDYPAGARYSASAFSIDKKGYIGCGYNASNQGTTTFYEYDPTLDTWTIRPAFPGNARGTAIGIGTDFKGYIGTGDGGALFRDFYEYDPSASGGAGGWNPMAPFPIATTSTPGRHGGTGFSINNVIYAGFGDATLNSNLQDFYQYNPTVNGGAGAWITKATVTNHSHEYSVSFTICGRGYMGTGFSPGSPSGTFHSDFWQYSPDLSASCACACSCSVLNLNVLLAGFYRQDNTGLMEHTLYTGGLTTDSTNADSIKIELMQPTFPYGLYISKRAIIKTNGFVLTGFSPVDVPPNSQYYIRVDHRNHIVTWSAQPITFGSLSTNYSFIPDASQAYANNQDTLRCTNCLPPGPDGRFGLFAGDLNRDCAVDASDFIELDSHIQIGDGGYIISDLSGDGAVDATDFLRMDPNIQMGIGCIFP